MPEITCVCFRLRRAAREVSQVYDRALAPVGLSLNEYSILRRCAATPRVLGELAAELGMDGSTLTRNVKPLADAGLLAVARGDDARQRVLTVTTKGHQRLAKAKPLWQRAQRETAALLGDTATIRLNATLDALHDRYAQRVGA